MIVISGALVLVALILLIIGLIDPSLGFVWASIGVSLASFAFLAVGILQRRKEDQPAAGELATGLLPSGGIPADATEGVSTLAPVMRKATGTAATSAGSAAGTVLVVAGRPRYHVEGCRYLTGKEADRADVSDAREEGFTACGVCKPDESLEAAADLPASATSAADTAKVDTGQADAATTVTEMPAVTSNVKTATKPAIPVVAPPAKADVKAPAKAATKTATKAAVTAPAKAATKTAVKAPAKAAVAAPVKAATKAPAKAPVKTAAKTAAKAPAAKAPAKAAAPVKRGMVVVIPDRGKFHTAHCRYVRGAEDTLELTKTAATKQGYAACGVCNP